MRVLPACMSMHHVSAWCPQTSEEGIRSPQNEIRNGFELPCGYWESISNLLKDHQMLLTTESSLHSPTWYWFWRYEGIVGISWGFALCGRVGALKRGHWWGCSVSSNGDARTLEITIAICNHCKRQQQMWGEGWPVSVKYAICSLSGRDREVEWGVHALRSPENCKYVLDIKHFLYCRSLDVLWFDCDCTLVLPLWSKRYLIWILFLLLFYKSPQLRDFGLWKRHWIFKENLFFFFYNFGVFEDCGTFKVVWILYCNSNVNLTSQEQMRNGRLWLNTDVIYAWSWWVVHSAG